MHGLQQYKFKTLYNWQKHPRISTEPKKPFGKNGKTNMVIYITHLKTLNPGARIQTINAQ